MRVKLNRKKIEQYAREKRTGSHFPSPVVFVDPDEIYWTGDGFHRIEADHLNGKSEVEIMLKAGTVKEAILFNLKANRENQGLQFASGDITKSIKRLLTDRLFKNWTRRQISDAIGCTLGMVSRVAIHYLGLPRSKKSAHSHPYQVDEGRIVELLAIGKSYNAIAKELGVSRSVIYRVASGAKFMPCPHYHGSGRVLKQQQGVA